VLFRVINPRIGDTGLGGAETVLGSNDPSAWKPADLQAILNLNHVIADGLHNMPKLLCDTSAAPGAMNLDRHLLRFSVELDSVPVPASVMDMISWRQFCYLIGGRVLGRVL
jgi:hypothetical protein